MLRSSDLYRRMHRVTKFADDYYLDAVIGLIPGGIGDIIGGLFSLMHVYFGLIKLRSIPLTLALLNNMLRDILLGLLPFYVGDVIDFLHKANKKNMALIDGFVNDDKRNHPASQPKGYSGSSRFHFPDFLYLHCHLAVDLHRKGNRLTPVHIKQKTT